MRDRPDGPAFNSHVREGVVTGARYDPEARRAGTLLRLVTVPHLRCSHSLLPVNHALTDVATECRPSGPFKSLPAGVLIVQTQGHPSGVRVILGQATGGLRRLRPPATL
jgi:hypothetical protein